MSVMPAVDTRLVLPSGAPVSTSAAEWVATHCFHASRPWRSRAARVSASSAFHSSIALAEPVNTAMNVFMRTSWLAGSAIPPWRRSRMRQGRLSRREHRRRPSPRQRMAEDAREHAAVLGPEPAAVVAHAVARADFAHARGDVGVARRRQVGEQVVLDLVAEVAGQPVEGAAALEVARAEDLAQVPLAVVLVLHFAPGEGLRVLGEVPAEDDRVGPHVADAVGDEVAEQHA